MKKRLKFKRRRLGITDYRKRLRLLLSGKPRLVVRKTLNNIIAEIAVFDPRGDKILAYADVVELRRKYGWKAHANLPAAYLVGYLIGKKALAKGVKEAVLDIGRIKATKGGKVFAVLKGAVDAGLEVPHSPEVLPAMERIKGRHIAEYAKHAKAPVFNLYRQRGLNPEELPKHFEETLEKIRGGA